MPIISVSDNGNNRWKRNAKKKKKKKKKKKQGGTEAIMKRWELIDFAMHLSQVFSN